MCRGLGRKGASHYVPRAFPTKSSSGPTRMKEQLSASISNRSAVVGVIGLGYVGLPLAVEFGKAGFTVVGFDVSTRVCALLNRGESHIQDVPAKEVAELVKSGKFIATTDAEQLRRTDAISIAVP